MKNALQRLAIVFADRRNHQPSAFTLIEVMVAMAIITVIVLMVSNMFLNSSEAWDIGTRKAELTTAGRASLGFIAQEMAQAVAGPVESAEPGAAAYLPFRVIDDSELAFLALSQEPSSSTRALRGVFFRLDGTDLKYSRRTSISGAEALNCYGPGIWSQTHLSGAAEHTLLNNVQRLEFYVYETLNDLINGTFVNAGVDLDKLPVCADVYLEILSDADMKTADSLSGSDKAEFMNKNAKAYSTRVYFPNRPGYSGDL